ncbi:putative fungal pheromoneG-protein-coupled receptor [Amylocystis lapponica]|nr:putative fungal pheromoneG-protein-coupled receptor [Amylocystis lapponica]
MTADPTYPLYVVVSFVGFVLALIPLPWHWQAWNSGTCYYMTWTALACLNEFVNSVIWSSNALDIAPVWCDISTRITIGASVGIPAASLCINRRLYKIACTHAVVSTRAEKRRTILIDTMICVLLPVIYMVLAYVVQGHRYNIFEVLGCYPAIYNTLLAYFLVYMWPVVIGLISAVYCVLSLRSLLARQAQFKKFLASNSNLTSGRYFRLMALAATELIFTVPFGIYEIYSNAASGSLQPWDGWANTHYDFSRVVLYPAVVWTMDPSVAVPLQLSRWIIPACAFVFFSFFGFAEEARKHYYKLYVALLRLLHISHMSEDTSNMSKHMLRPPHFSPSNPELPVYSPPLSRPPRCHVSSSTVSGSDGEWSPSLTSLSEKFPLSDSGDLLPLHRNS